MSETREYEVVVGGVLTTMLLDDEGARRYGVRAVRKSAAKPKAKAVMQPLNKARASDTK